MSHLSPLHFPDAATMTQYLSNHPSLDTDYFKEKGITKAIVELAVARFANSDREEISVKHGAMLLIYDLTKGRDGFKGKALPNLGKLELPPMIWSNLACITELALIDCAKEVDITMSTDRAPLECSKKEEIATSSPTLHFPDAATMIQYLSNHPLLKTPYFEEKGITKAIAEHAATIFADRNQKRYLCLKTC